MEALLSFVRRQIGLRTEAADSSGSLHAKVTKVKEEVSDINFVLNTGVLPPQAQASDSIRLSSDSEKCLDPFTTWTKAKEIKVLRTGYFRVSFDIRVEGSSTVYGEVYRNDSPYGGTRSTTSTTYVSFSQDLFFEMGDLVQLYVKAATADVYVYVRNFRIRYDTVVSEGFVFS